jgi:hypothetical protein
VTSNGGLMLEALRRPELMASLSLRQWELFLPLARNSGLLSRLAALAEERGLDRELPEKVVDYLNAARAVARHHETCVRWEVNRIRRALCPTRARIILLKGAAYILGGLSAGRGRLVGDVDILVAKGELEAVEQALLEAGWEPAKLHPYDQRYYRTWMHELPPLRHRERRTTVDVHHTILPETARVHPDADELRSAARPLDPPELFLLAPEDMVLHAAAHLFQDGDLTGGLRDLCDLDALLRQFGDSEPGFWERLAERGRTHELERALFYALRFCRRLLRTPMPEGVIGLAHAGAPIRPVTRIMDALATRALVPGADGGGARGGAARWLLYVRSHWMRMPPWLLAGHLLRKSLRRWLPDEPG